MKINPIFKTYQSRVFQNKRMTLPIKVDSFEKTVFTGNLPYELSKNLPFEYSIYDLIDLAQNSQTPIGVGANSSVYDIPYLDDYVLKVLNKDDPNGVELGEFPSSINLGQPVWQNDKNPRNLILRKVRGKEHSIPSWSRTIWEPNIQKPLLVTKEQAQIYFDSVDRLAKMPQESFDEIAYKAKLLDDKEYKIDSINPNNLIVDENEIHIIDYFKVKPWELDVYRNCSYDLVAIMLDFTLLPEYMEKMDSVMQAKFLENAKTIFEKVQKASKNVGFSTDVEIYKTFINETSKWFVTTSAIEEDGTEHIRLYDYRANDFLNFLNSLTKNEADNISFTGNKYQLQKQKGDYIFFQDFPIGEDNGYKIIYYSDSKFDVNENGERIYPPSKIIFDKPIDMQTALEVCEKNLLNYEQWSLDDSKQISKLREFMKTCDELKNEKIVSVIDAIHHTLVLELEGNRVLKMIAYNPFPKERPFDKTFDLPVLSKVYECAEYYVYVQEKADTDCVDEEALDSVIKRIVAAGYIPYDIIGNETQIGWSEIAQNYMLLDSECAKAQTSAPRTLNALCY